jgi:NADPH:quinone reductase
VVYDGVGKDTFFVSLDCLAPRGLLVSYGNASGAVPPFELLELSNRSSLYVTRPTLAHYVATREALEAAAAELFDVVGRGAVRVHVAQRYPLAEAAQAHADLQARRTTGSIVLTP